MIEDENVSLETDHLEEVIEVSPPGQPVVVIEYRNRGVPWFVVIALLLGVSLAAAAIYHRAVMRKRLYERSPVVRQAARPAAETSAPELPGPAAPLALNSQPLPPGTILNAPSVDPAHAVKPEVPKKTAADPVVPPEPKAAEPTKLASEPAKPAPAATPEPPRPPRNPPAPIFAIPKPPGDGDTDNPFRELFADQASGPPSEPDETLPAAPEPPAEQAAADRPPPTKDELLQDIKAEAAMKRQELDQLRDLKDRATDELAAEALDRTENERHEFRRELDEILRSNSRTAGREINELCDKFGRNYDPALRDKVARALRVASGRMTTSSRLNLLRHYGVPEAGVLDFLAREIDHRQMNSRNGPRTPDQVRVIAARQLLRYGISKSTRGPATAEAGAAAADRAGAPVSRIARPR